MLRRIAYMLLPRDPQEVRLLHHTGGGVVIAAVSYTKTSSPLFFTVVEMAAPNEQALPLRVVHVRVPRPATVVSAITLMRSADGADVYVIVQAAEKTNTDAAPTSTTSYVYRRQIVADDEQDDYAAEDDVVSSPAASAVPAATRVRYQRLPRAFASAGATTWTAVAVFNPSENMLTDASSSVDPAVTPTAAFITASCDGADNQLQLWQLRGTGVTLEATWRVPALAGFAVQEILTLPGTQDVVLLRHHNSIIEVNLSALRSACAYGSTVTGNTFLSRAWRWSVREQLTACAVKDALLYAGTEGVRCLCGTCAGQHPPPPRPVRAADRHRCAAPRSRRPSRVCTRRMRPASSRATPAVGYGTGGGVARRACMKTRTRRSRKARCATWPEWRRRRLPRRPSSRTARVRLWRCQRARRAASLSTAMTTSPPW
ncbi:hypothetical_protein (plasmid) [Leishmania braziliensis MHOM/BR/75/M2904]|uniref:Hypothetical_protein n=1 Tax=Leishmania braziliensis MHOM/BR/75/M2904 TaxID=420245 RepID=A0A3P3Z606_LEIBR|nr:hypothetical_protein [Leishmania braziliensis MHOM/BR/75/M2904]